MEAVLIVAPDRELLTTLSQALTGAGYHVTTTTTFEEGRRALAASSPGCLIAAVRLGAFNGLQLVLRLRSDRPGVPAIVLATSSDLTLESEAQRLGALWLRAPFTAEAVTSAVAEALVRHDSTADR